MKYFILYEPTGKGWTANVPDLSGLNVVGDTLEDVKKLIRERIDFHVEALRQRGEALPQPTTLMEDVEVQWLA